MTDEKPVDLTHDEIKVREAMVAKDLADRNKAAMLKRSKPADDTKGTAPADDTKGIVSKE